MISEYPTLLNDFENFAVDPTEFGHLQHVQIAFEMLNKYSYIEATYKYAKAIKTIASNAGATDKFNVTITYAFMSLIAERISQSNDVDFDQFRTLNPDVLNKNVLSDWYSSERLGSKGARQRFIFPDKPGSLVK